MSTLEELVEECLRDVKEIMAWTLVERMEENPRLLIVDVREPYEYDAMHIDGSLNVPRGVLEAACEWGYEDTLPELASGRGREIVVVCRSGRRSVLAAYAMQRLGFESVVSLRTGLRGWNDYEEPLVDSEGARVDADEADRFFLSRVRRDQMAPNGEA
ncbi:rhodanese-like domain-containing protein [Chlorobium sp. N1]|uniref:rhodanese-like domain-containing protein n=1 Tax=Chlorobium sp. N1 TaxID=2491138 RepID=UPI00103B6DCC|nr:rhodanese-like domain-containing protein [Chlorobium sp. N1]TCD48227.1 rhodanese-like domain-containing protein [Chlorobium sp. N1]